MSAITRQDARREKLLNGSIPKVITSLAIPSIISSLVMSIYNMTDTFFVSSLGSNATAAVGVNHSLMQFIQMAGSSLAIGGASYISRLLGAKKDREASQVMSTVFFSAMFTGTLVMILGLLFMDPLVRLGATETVIPYSRDYASYILYAAPFMTTVFVMNQCLRSEGSSTFSMIGMVSGAVLNLALDPLFIFVFGWGVAGAAAATAVSKFISFIVLIIPYMRRKSLLHLSPKNISYTKDIVAEVAKMGFPTLLRSGFMTIAGVVTNNVAGSFSVSALASISVVNRIMQFFASALLGFGHGYQPVAGFNWGAKRYNRVIASFKFATIAGVSFVSFLCLFAAIFAEQIMGLFTTTDKDMIELGVFSIRLQCYAMPMHAFAIVVNSTYSALGRATGAAILSLSRQGITFIPAIFVLSILFGVRGLAAAQAAADVMVTMIALPFAIHIIKVCTKKLKEETNQSAQLKTTGALSEVAADE